MNKDKRKIFFIVGLIVIILLIVGIVFKIVKSNNANEKVMNDINTSYGVIEDDISSYNEVRNNLIKVMDGYYSINLGRDYNKFIYILGKEEELLSSILKEVEKLDDLCLDRLFKKKEINNICDNYKVYYETVYNVHINDVNKINGYIDSYNNQNNEKLDGYSSNNTDYIDYDGNGIFLEREDSNGEG